MEQDIRETATEDRIFEIQEEETTAPGKTAIVKWVNPYIGIARNEFNEEQRKRLLLAIPPEVLDILPTGEIYLPQVHYRRILNDTFGPGRWALAPLSRLMVQGNTICQEWALYVNGNFVAQAMGTAEYYENKRTSRADAAESVKSNALMRTCKDLGIASECWDKSFTRDWITKYAVKVWCIGAGRDNKGEKKPLWRRRDGERFDFPWREQGAVQETEKPKEPERPVSSSSAAEQAPYKGKILVQPEAGQPKSSASPETIAEEEIENDDLFDVDAPEPVPAKSKSNPGDDLVAEFTQKADGSLSAIELVTLYNETRNMASRLSVLDRVHDAKKIAFGMILSRVDENEIYSDIELPNTVPIYMYPEWYALYDIASSTKDYLQMRKLFYACLPRMRDEKIVDEWTTWAHTLKGKFATVPA